MRGGLKTEGVFYIDPQHFIEVLLSFVEAEFWLMTKDGVEIDQVEVSLFYGYAIFNVDELKAGDYILHGKFDWA